MKARPSRSQKTMFAALGLVLVLGGSCLAVNHLPSKKARVFYFGHKNQRATLLGATFSPQGNIAVASFLPNNPINASADVRLSDRTQRHWLRLPQEETIFELSFIVNGKLLATASGVAIKVWDVRTGHLLKTLKHEYGVDGVFGDPQSDLLLSHSMHFRESSFTVWRPREGVKLLSFSTGETSVKGVMGGIPWPPALAVSFKRQTVAVGDSQDSVAGLWNLNTGKYLRMVGKSDFRTTALAFSPDGRILAGASTDGALRFWNAQTGQLLRTLQKPTTIVMNTVAGNVVLGLAFSPDGKTVASSGQSTTLWDGATGTAIRKVPTPFATYKVAFSADGKTLATTDSIFRSGVKIDRTSSLRLWRVR